MRILIPCTLFLLKDEYFFFLAALSGLDYIPSTSNLSFPAGSTGGTLLCVDISIIDDNVLERNESFTVTLSTMDPGVVIRDGHTTNITITSKIYWFRVFSFTVVCII